MNDTWYSCVVFSEIEVLLTEQCSVSKAVKRPALSFESVDHVSCHDSLPLGVLGVGHRVPHHVLQEHAQHRPHLLVDESGDPLDAAPPGQPSDGGLGDALDVVPQHLAVTLGASLAESLASLATSSHVAVVSDTAAQALPVRSLYAGNSQ